MQAFGDIDKIMHASEEQLSRVEGIGPALAARIRAHFEAL